MKKNEGVINSLKKFWDFVWNGESTLSLIVFIVLVFLIIKFIFFPILMFVTGTSLPLAIVESCSMHHDEGFDDWWNENENWYENINISKQDFKDFYFHNGFNKGDIFFVRGIKAENVKIGDVIIFSSGNQGRDIIHRVVALNPIETKGDNNNAQFNLEQSEFQNPERIDETEINANQLIGKVTFLRIPFAGWIKLIFYEPFRPKSQRGFCK